jgi:ubiquinone/menaquinone biosynthesis C-methylase UbiE
MSAAGPPQGANDSPRGAAQRRTPQAWGDHTNAAGPLRARFGAAGEPRASTAEVDWYRERLPRDAGPCLEVMCGYGRLLVPLVEAGLNVHGVDISPAMLAECEAGLTRAALAAPLFRQDVAELNVPFRYAAASIPGGAFQRLTDVERALAALLRIRAHLVDPALLCIDLYVPAERVQRIAAPQIEVRTATLADGSRIALRSETTMLPDVRLARTANRYVLRRGNDLVAEENETVSVTWYAEDEIAALLADAGFRDVKLHSSPRESGEDRTFCVSARVAA